jgi:hypothetical protein
MTRRLALFAAVIALSILAMEGVLRLTGYEAREWRQPDRDLGWTLRPGPGVNPAGVRDREHLLHKPAGVYRIVVLGDDYSEARELPVQLTWWRLLPDALERCGFAAGRRVEALSFAVAGYGTAQQYVMLESRALRYRPDLVVLQLSADDVRDNSFALTGDKDRPFFMLEADGGLRIDDAFASSPAFLQRMSIRARLARGLVDRSRLLQLALSEPVPPAGAGEAPPRLWDEARRVTEKLVAMTAELAERNGARFLLVAAPGDGVRGRSPDSVPLLALPAGHREAAALIARHLCPPAVGDPAT